jgi:hypothetical protein
MKGAERMIDTSKAETGMGFGSSPHACFQYQSGDEVVTVHLDAESVGYALDTMSEVVRIYDKENTYLLHQQYLVLFKFPVRRRDT